MIVVSNKSPEPRFPLSGPRPRSPEPSRPPQQWPAVAGSAARVEASARPRLPEPRKQRKPPPELRKPRPRSESLPESEPRMPPLQEIRRRRHMELMPVPRSDTKPLPLTLFHGPVKLQPSSARRPVPEKSQPARPSLPTLSPEPYTESPPLPYLPLSIYRIPRYLRNIHEIAYAPQCVSLGPYHRGLDCLHGMEFHKRRALNRALIRTGHDVSLYFDAVRFLQDRARGCYEAPLSLSDDAFIESLVLDAIFVLEIFRGTASEGFQWLGYAPNDPVFAVRGTMHSLQRDMILLENQLPLFILDRILALQLGHDPSRSGIVSSLALCFFDPLIPTYEPLPSAAAFNPLADASNSGALHCLDIFRRSLLLAVPQLASRPLIRRRWFHGRPVADKRRLQLIHCVTELCDAGIKFRRRIMARFWNITFKDGVLHIPHLLIHDGTKSLFLNLIAFEQCHLECSNHITSYVIFMNNLIKSEVDVGHLHEKGIIEHCRGNNREVADLFNGLCREVVFNINDSYLSKLSGQVNDYTSHKWNAWRANLIHKYFSNPWTIISLFAAAVLLLLNFTQTFYAVYGYYKPNK